MSPVVSARGPGTPDAFTVLNGLYHHLTAHLFQGVAMHHARVAEHGNIQWATAVKVHRDDLIHSRRHGLRRSQHRWTTKNGKIDAKVGAQNSNVIELVAIEIRDGVRFDGGRERNDSIVLKGTHRPLSK